jgi:23S rRNA pseudouridine2604 synthase
MLSPGYGVAMSSQNQHWVHDGPETMRINKFMGQSGIASRRDAEALIAAGRVRVDGQTVTEPGARIGPGQVLELAPKDSHAVTRADAPLTVLLNKPPGFVSAHPQPGETPAVALLEPARSLDTPAQDLRALSLAPLGRLDLESRGLLLLSSDGVLAKAVIGPDSALPKRYLVDVGDVVRPDQLARLRHGLTLDGRALKKAVVNRQGDGRLEFRLQEGRNRQIRRMCASVGLPVHDLQRTHVGPVSLDGLSEGSWRLLQAEERAALLAGATRGG